MIQIITVGKKHEDWVKDGIERYERRLRKPFSITWTIIPHSHQRGEAARIDESRRIRERVHGDSVLFLFDQRGTIITNDLMEESLEEVFNRSNNATLVIGGAYGVSDELRRDARQVWSLSGLVLPHQLVRLLLVEQIYRTQEISRGGAYHHE